MREGHKQTFARYLRKNMTDAERALWQVLHNRVLSVYKFRRQHPVGPYIVDLHAYRRTWSSRSMVANIATQRQMPAGMNIFAVGNLMC